MGLTQTADWDESNAAGVILYDDGTLWVWNCEMAHPSQADHFTTYVNINELAPGAKAWEQLTPDTWSTDYYNWGDKAPAVEPTGRLVEKMMMSGQWKICNDGGDISYWFPDGGVDNQPRPPSYDQSVMIVNKATRTWEYKLLGYSMNSWGYPVLWDGYMWFLGSDGTLYNDTTACLYRMSTVSPYPVEKVKTWASDHTAKWDLDTTTNLPRFFSEAMWSQDNATGIDDDGYFYLYGAIWESGQYLEDSDGRGMSVIRRMLLPDGEWETLYYYYVADGSAQTFTYNLPGANRNDRWHGPLPIGLGMRPSWYSNMKVRDGFLYWVDASTFFSMRSFGWTGGQMFQRIELSRLEDGWVEHQPENPIVEVLSMTTGAEDSFYNWDDNAYWGNNGGYAWRDGLDSIHAYVEPNWQFDADGSIIFLHHEYPTWWAEPNDWYPPYVLSRLSPPENIPITFNLVFEGTELKGYGHVRQVPAKTRIGTIELTGE